MRCGLGLATIVALALLAGGAAAQVSPHPSTDRVAGAERAIPRRPQYAVAVRHRGAAALRLHVLDELGWHDVCRTPCEATPSWGRWRLAVSAGLDAPVRVAEPYVDVISDGILTLSLEPRSDEHDIGIVLLVTGALIAAGAAVAFAALAGWPNEWGGSLVALLTIPFATGVGVSIAGGALLGLRPVAHATFAPRR